MGVKSVIIKDKQGKKLIHLKRYDKGHWESIVANNIRAGITITMVFDDKSRLSM